MSLRHFLNAAYAVLFDEYQRWGMNLFDAIEALKEFAEGYNPEPVPALPAGGRAPRAVAVQNTRAMDELEKMLGGVR